MGVASVNQTAPPLSPPESVKAMSPPLTPATSRATSVASSPTAKIFADEDIADNYVTKTLANTKPRVRGPWYKEIEWISTIFIVGLPFLCLYGLLTTKLNTKTALFSVAYYYFSGLGEFPSNSPKS